MQRTQEEAVNKNALLVTFIVSVDLGGFTDTSVFYILSSRKIEIVPGNKLVPQEAMVITELL